MAKRSNLAKHGIPAPDYKGTPTHSDQENPKNTITEKSMLRRRHNNLKHGHKVKWHGDRLESDG
jgi:hypothetical protein